ncbi:MAG: hypothetical protein F7B18_04605 [Desulfurococcales archaeon]|nr:hypothetical protein [Desulfurococcales archaeon]
MERVGPLESLHEFAKWLRSLGGLKTFWTKPVEQLYIRPGDPARLLVHWRARRGCRRAEILLQANPYVVDDLLEYSSECTLMVASGAWEERYPRSMVYVYTMSSRLLEPNTRVEVEVHDANRRVLESVEKVQRRSWGFYMPPLPGSIVVLAGYTASQWELHTTTLPAAISTMVFTLIGGIGG